MSLASRVCRFLPAALACTVSALAPRAALSFCGIYVASGDAKLFNESSQVVLVRDEDRTVLTMVSDYQGDPKEFAVVIPVPTVVRKQDVQIGDAAVVEHLDRYSAPRLVEYYDPPPCREAIAYKMAEGMTVQELSVDARHRGGRADEVRVLDRYKVGEYDIVILDADRGDALERWLRAHHYRIPTGAAPVLSGYLRQGMRFFVAKVDLKEQARLGVTKLRPIRVRYESARFGLPIRLGMANARGPQDLIVHAITRSGRVEVVNYRTVKLPTAVEIPERPDAVRRLLPRALRRAGAAPRRAGRVH